MQPHDRPLTRRDRFNLALVLTAISMLGLAATCGACLNSLQLPAPTRSFAEQHAAAILFRHTCVVEKPLTAATGDIDVDTLLATILGEKEEHVFMGSGVLVSEDRALTNAHVVQCPDGKGKHKTLEASADGYTWISATIEIMLPERDVARVMIAGNLEKWFTPVSMVEAKPGLGEELCADTMWPRANLKCERVQPSPISDLYTFGFVEYGNSGSAVYWHGKLVGLISAALFCQSSFPCEGLVEQVWDLPWLIP